MSELATRPAPVRETERIVALDVLRGVAILGILVMNVQAFSMPFASYSNLAMEDPSTTDYWVWGLAHLFAEMKFMTLFSILFGAGVALMLERLEARELSAAAVHYRRTVGLLLIGAAHAYLLWYGDILVSYAICALLLYFFRHVRPKRLVIVGSVVLMISPLITQVGALFVMPQPGAEVVAEASEEATEAEESAAAEPGAAATEGDGAAAADEEDATAAAMAELMAERERLSAEETADYRGGWWKQMGSRVPMSFKLQTWGLGFFVLWRALGLMLIGMALYRWGVITAARSPAFYRRLAAWGLGVGLPLCAAGMVILLVYDFAPEISFGPTMLFNYVGSVGVSLGYLALVMLWCRVPRRTPLQGSLAAVGRMALTNYLLQTVICIFVFYGGYGLGLFGHVSRFAQLGVVAAVWGFEMLISPWWLTHFRFGPAEWLWRTMTYLKPQPMRR